METRHFDKELFMKNKKSSHLYIKPNPLTYGFVRSVSKFISRFVYPVEIVRNELTGSSGRRVILANHEADIDFFSAYAAIPGRAHVVASQSIISTLPIAPLAAGCGVITKNQFQTSVTDLHKMKAVVDHEEPLLLYPSGLMTESGASTPIPTATGKVAKWFDADIYIAKITGTYLMKPKWASKKRRGKATLDIYKLATREELAAMSDEDAEALIEKHLSFDAYRNNERLKNPYKNGENMEGLENVLYKCPDCGADYSIGIKDGRSLICYKCGYTVSSDEYGMLYCENGQEPVYKYPTDWHSYIERSVFDEVRSNPDFLLEGRARIQKINEKRHRFVEVGEGCVSLDYDNFTIDGAIFGEPTHRRFRTDIFPILPFRPGKYFEIQHGHEILRIIPEDPRQIMHWILVLKATYRLKHEQAAISTANA